MKLEKAIETQENLLRDKSSNLIDSEVVSILLGIEAMKEIERLRPHIHYHVQQLLRGETKD